MSISNSSEILTPGQTTLTSKGDILSHNGTTNIRIAAGSNGLAITANSASVGGMYYTTAPTTPVVGYEAISYTTNTAAVSSVEFTNISGAYRVLHFVVISSHTATTDLTTESMYIRLNSSSSSLYKSWATARTTAATTRAFSSATQTQIDAISGVTRSSYTNGRGLVHGWIHQYANTAAEKCGYIKSFMPRSDTYSTGGGNMYEAIFEYASTSAITAISFFAGVSATARTFASGSKFYIYGVK